MTDNPTTPNVNTGDEPVMTFYQMEKARHALGLGNGKKQSYRNYFVTGAGSLDYAGWIAMTENGLAKRWDGAKLHFGGDDFFRLTRTGAEAALFPGETLDPENFPTQPDSTP